MPDSNLPDSWLRCELGEVIKYGAGKAASPAEFDQDQWLLELEDIESNTSKILQRLTVGDRSPKSSKNKFKCGDVLYGKLRPYLNKVVIADQEGLCTTEIIPISPEELDGRYLFYWLKSSEFIAYVNSVSHGMRMPRLGTKQAKAAPVVLAPRAEQTRIVNKLNELLAQVDTIKARVDAIPGILKRFRQSVLAAAVSGRLTEEGGEWPEVPVGELCLTGFDGPFGSKLKTEDYTNSGYLVARLENIGHLEYLSSKKTYIGHEKYESLERNHLHVGDILFSSFVDEEIRVCVLPELETGIINKADCFCLRTNKKVASEDFVAFSLASHDTYLRIREAVHGATRPRINLKFLKSLPIRIPPIETQKRIVQVVHQMFGYASIIEQRTVDAQLRIERLTKSILAKAFRGELVPQNPDDEPASVLLERIQMERSKTK